MAEKRALRRVRAGDAISAREWNELVERVTRNEIRANNTGGLNVQKTAFGVVLSLASRPGQMLAKTSSAISARSGTTAGTGTVTPQYLNGTTLGDDGQDLTVYFFSASASIDSGKYCWIEQDRAGVWWITAVEC